MDFLELYSGKGRMSRAFLLRGYNAMPPLDIESGFDLEFQAVLFWIINLLRCGRIRLLWLGPPCTSFSVARWPRLRSFLWPEGYDLFHWEVIVGNYHAMISDFFAWIQMAVGNWFIKEQPGGGAMKRMASWKYLQLCGADMGYFDYCRFGAECRKYSVLLYFVGSRPWLDPIFLRCNHGKGVHRVLEGQATSRAAAYTSAFCCSKVAELASSAWQYDRECAVDCSWSFLHPSGPEPRDFKARNVRKHVGHLWATELSECLVWKPIVNKHVSRGHINVQELKAHTQFVKD